MTAAWLAGLLSTLCVSAQDEVTDPKPPDRPAQYNERPQHAARATAAYGADLTKYDGNDDILVLPGLVADRNNRRVDLMVEATGIEPGTIVEFLLIDADSSKGYEALLWSHARPSAIHRALQFIGMKPGN